MEKTVYFVRHAQSHPSQSTHFSQWPLSDLGRLQADTLANCLNGLGIQKIYSSPFLRCLDTVRPFAKLSGVDIEIRDDLRERLVTHGIAGQDLWEKSWDDFNFAVPSCESSLDAQRRFVAAVNHIVETANEDVLAISSHGNVIGLFLNHLDGRFSRFDAEKIINPHLLKFQKVGAEFRWDRHFELAALNEVATHHSATPIRA